MQSRIFFFFMSYLLKKKFFYFSGFSIKKRMKFKKKEKLEVISDL